MAELSSKQIKEMVLSAEQYLISLWDNDPVKTDNVTHDKTCDIFMYVRDYGKPSVRGVYKNNETHYMSCSDGDTHIIEFYLYVDGAVTELMVDTEYKESTGMLTIEDCHVK